MNLSEQRKFIQRLLQTEEQNYEVEIKKVNFLCNSSLEAILHLYVVQKALLTCKIKQKITLVTLQNFE